MSAWLKTFLCVIAHKLANRISVLLLLALIFVSSGSLMVFGPKCRISEAKEVFDFVKTMAPPIATLVIRFYFRNESA